MSLDTKPAPLNLEFFTHGPRAGKGRNGMPQWQLRYEGPRASARLGAAGEIQAMGYSK